MGGDPFEDVGQPSLRVDIVDLGGPDQGVEDRGALATAVRAAEEPRLAPQRNLGVILPMLGLRSRSTTAGTRSTGVGFGGTTANSVLLASLFMSRRSRALS